MVPKTIVCLRCFCKEAVLGRQMCEDCLKQRRAYTTTPAYRKKRREHDRAKAQALREKEE